MYLKSKAHKLRQIFQKKIKRLNKVSLKLILRRDSANFTHLKIKLNKLLNNKKNIKKKIQYNKNKKVKKIGKNFNIN